MGSFFEWILESSLLILMILGIRKIFMGKIHYAGIYALWLVVLLRLMIPVNFISTPISVGNIISDRFSNWSAAEITEQNPDSSEFTGINQQLGAQTGKVWSTNSDWELSGQSVQSQTVNTEEQSYISQKPQSTENNDTQEVIKKRTGVNGKFIFAIGWVLVSVLLLLWFVFSNICLLRKLKQNRLLYGQRDKVKIYAVSGIQNPCLYGFFRPVIYLPKFLVYGDTSVRADKDEIEQMITHEYVHYCHRDYIWAMFRMLLVSVYWFNPLVWIAVSCSKKDAELYCDETVIRLLGEEKRFCYGKMLVRLASDASWGDFRYPIMSMSRRGKEMERRIRAISMKKRYSKWVFIPLAVVVLGAAGITCSTGVKPLARENESENQVTSESTVLRGVGEQKGLIKDKAEQFSGLGMSNQLFAYSNLFHVYGSPLEKVFQDYINIFTEAVNTGNTDKMHQVLAVGSDVYSQQCNLAKNYYKRGIHEEVKACSISSLNTIAPNQVKINSNEKIKVYYGDDTTKIVKQKYQYTCEYRNGCWLITIMEDIPLS